MKISWDLKSVQKYDDGNSGVLTDQTVFVLREDGQFLGLKFWNSLEASMNRFV